jgi:NADH dehydrogenase FAD-containing subunit
MTEHQPGWDQAHTAPPPRDSVWRRFRPSPPRQLLSDALSDRWPHVVIVGGGFAGLNAAKALRDTPVRITLLDARNYHLFQSLLYQVAAASLSPADISSPIRSVLRRQRNVRGVMAEAVGVDLDRRAVRLSSGRCSRGDRHPI